MYSVQLIVTDPSGTSLSTSVVGGNPDAKAQVVIYDPNGGALTGGGWIWSPAGAFALDPSAAGKAEFELSARYEKGATVPGGGCSFRFSLAGLEFVSTANEWLVVSDARAQCRGSGTLNGLPGFVFLLTAVDGDAKKIKGDDLLRMKIWDGQTGETIYDNQPGSNDDGALNAATLVRGGVTVRSK